MQPHHELLRDLLVLFGFATLIAVVLQRARQSTIVAYLLTGLLVGPSGLGLITNREAIELMAEIGVILLLFTIGIEFSLKKLLRMRQVVLGAGSRQVGLTLLVTLSVAFLFAYPWRQGLFWGFLVAASSTAIVLKLLFERQELDSMHGRAIVGILLFQDLCVVPMMAILPAFTAPTSAIALAILYALGKALAVVAMIFFVAHYLFPPLWRTIAQLRNKEIFLIATIFFSLGTAWVAGELGLSLALGAFLAGLALSESEFAHQILSEILPFRDSFASLFFISIGMLINMSFVSQNWTIVAAVAAGIILVKLICAAGAMLTLGFPLRMSLLVGLALAHVGEFSFVLLQQGAGLDLIGESNYQIFLAAAVISMMITPVVIQVSPALAARLSEMRALTRFFPEPGPAQLEQKATRFHDHVIVCGYGLNGQLTASLLRRAKIPYLVLETNPETVRRAAAEQEPIFFGDGSNQAILEKAGVERARAIAYAISDPFVLGRAVYQARRLNPRLQILVRTKRVDEGPELERAGASQIISEEMEAAEEIIIHLLGHYGFSRKDAYEQLEAARAEMKPTQVE
ncbi:cation:proton antiporter [Acidobacteriia bacterium AH_259_A11_L15]|nr:cation:proton antiporter [Acidobacteriia bacterium AH_259_A11_L15]